jgi:hypothetical protein
MLRAARPASECLSRVAPAGYALDAAMDPMAIIGIALGVGAVVYALSLRARPEDSLPGLPGDETLLPVAPEASRGRLSRARSDPDALGFSNPIARAPEPDVAPLVYVPVLAAPGPRWRDRLAGLVGLIAIVIVGAVALAAGVYQVGHMANRMFEQFLGP